MTNPDDIHLTERTGNKHIGNKNTGDERVVSEVVDESVYKAIATAYHEAGHAVMALSFGRRVSSEKQHERLKRRLLARTEHLLGDEETALAIELVAKELMQKQTISGRAVRHFYQQATRRSS